MEPTDSPQAFCEPDWRSLENVARLIDLALAEDIGPQDITTRATVDPAATGTGEIIAKQDLVVAGLAVAHMVFARLDPDCTFEPRFVDGTCVTPGQTIARVRGRLAPLLTAERTALNFLQRLSGIATTAGRWQALVAGTSLTILDTRKTTCGWRVLEKYAVRVGGVRNHRMGLFDGIMIKDNHIVAAGGIARAVAYARAQAGPLTAVEVEAKTLDEVDEAVAAGADVIMCDNMDDDAVGQAVARIAGRARVEVSGGITADRLATLAGLGVDYVSAGALTHSVSSVDISMDLRA